MIPDVGAPGAWVTVRGAGFTAEGDVPGGGTRVTVTGSGFIDVKKVAFGTVTGTSLSVVSASELPGHRADSAAGSSSTRVRRVPS